MNDFTQYQEALELKQLGFNEPCFTVYEKNHFTLWSGTYQNNMDWKDIISAPTYSQAFRFFREKYGLCIVIKPIDDKKLDLGYNLLKNGLIINAHLTYEEAELGCLRHLIKTVKENENRTS